MSSRNWKPFVTKRHKFDPDEIRVKLGSDGDLAISLGAFNALRSPAAIALFYDPTDGLIGVAPADSSAPNAVPVRKRGGRAQLRRAGIREFLTSFGIPRPAMTIAFRKPTFDPDGTLVLNYREAMKEGKQ